MECLENIEPETKANILAGLAGCYARPGRDLDALLAANAEDASRMGDLGAQMFSDLMRQWRQNTLQELLVDYAALFVGPFETIAPPLGSVHLEEQPVLMGESTRNLLDIYRQAGLDMAENFNGPADHIIAELEFLAYLISARLSADPETAQTLHELQQRFLREHLGRESGAGGRNRILSATGRTDSKDGARRGLPVNKMKPSFLAKC
jgi:TorA maturation chaperone TorD